MCQWNKDNGARWSSAVADMVQFVLWYRVRVIYRECAPFSQAVVDLEHTEATQWIVNSPASWEAGKLMRRRFKDRLIAFWTFRGMNPEGSWCRVDAFVAGLGVDASRLVWLVDIDIRDDGSKSLADAAASSTFRMFAPYDFKTTTLSKRRRIINAQYNYGNSLG